MTRLTRFCVMGLCIVMIAGVLAFLFSGVASAQYSLWGYGFPGYTPFSLMNLSRFSGYPYCYMPALGSYSYLVYALKFFDMAQTTPFLYAHDPLADYYGALVANYASSYNIAPRQAIIPFMKEYMF
ncbi:MAG: hypothetical protein ACMUIL_07410 [bacterium]